MLYGSLAEVDPEIHALIEKEKERQFSGLELIASEVSSFLIILRGRSFLRSLLTILELHLRSSDGGKWVHLDQQVL